MNHAFMNCHQTYWKENRKSELWTTSSNCTTAIKEESTNTHLTISTLLIYLRITRSSRITRQGTVNHMNTALLWIIKEMRESELWTSSSNCTIAIKEDSTNTHLPHSKLVNRLYKCWARWQHITWTKETHDHHLCQRNACNSSLSADSRQKKRFEASTWIHYRLTS